MSGCPNFPTRNPTKPSQKPDKSALWSFGAVCSSGICSILTCREDVGGSSIEASKISGRTTVEYTNLQRAHQEELSFEIQKRRGRLDEKEPASKAVELAGCGLDSLSPRPTLGSSTERAFETVGRGIVHRSCVDNCRTIRPPEAPHPRFQLGRSCNLR